MVGALSKLDWLGKELFQTTELKLVVTFAAVGLLLFVLLSYRQLQNRLSERLRSVYGEIISTTVLVGACVGTAALVLGVWQQANTIVEIYQQQLGFGEDVLAKTIVSVILLIATYLFTRFLQQILDEVLGSSSAVTDHQREITHRITQVIIWSVSVVVVLGYWVEDLGGLLVGAGFLGIVVGMAARQTLGTVLAGFVLMFARPFEIGDWIEVGGEQGIVTDISIVNTRLRSFDGEYIMIPNDVISSSTVTNRSRRGRLRIEVEVGVDYETDLEYAAEIAESVVGDLEYTLAAPGPQVVAKEFGDSAVILGVRFWIDKPSARRHWRARTAAINAIKDAFDDEGIKIPFPQQELSGRAETGGFRIADDGPESTAGDDGDREQQLTPPEGD